MREKAIKIEQANNMPHVFYKEKIATNSEWQDIIGAAKKLILELGCGTGKYTTELARMFPDTTFIGVDYQGERIWRGATTATQDKLDNVFFLRAYIDHITEYLPNKSVDEIWLTFPDPQLRRKKWIKKRLTAPAFIERYKQILKPGGLIHLKTDNKVLFDYTHEMIQELGLKLIASIEDIHAQETIDPRLDIETVFEKRYKQQGLPIYYLSFKI